MGQPILYSFRRCPYAMRARMALLISKTHCEIREVKLSAKPEAMLAASPKGTVPVLASPDGAVVDESLDIMRWALAQNDPENWLAGDAPDLIAINDGPFKHHLDRYKYPHRHNSDAAEHRAAGIALLSPLEARLSASANLMGEGRSLADVAILPFVRQFADAGRIYFDSQPLPALQAWLARHLASALFAEAMVKRTAWKPGDNPVYLRPGA